VQSAINAAQSYLPANLPAPRLQQDESADAPVLTLAITSDPCRCASGRLVDTRLAPKTIAAQ